MEGTRYVTLLGVESALGFKYVRGWFVMENLIEKSGILNFILNVDWPPSSLFFHSSRSVINPRKKPQWGR